MIFLKKCVLIVICIVSWGYIAHAQFDVPWFEARSEKNINQDSGMQSDCDFVGNGVNNKTGYVEKELESKPFFVYTNPQVRKYMKNKYLVEGMANLYQVNNNIFLQIRFKINSANAKKNYGDLEKASKIKVTLSDRSTLYIENLDRERGKTNKKEGFTIYNGTYALNKDKVKEMKKHGIDNIAVLWEEGYEEYQIINTDLVKNQLSCL